MCFKENASPPFPMNQGFTGPAPPLKGAAPIKNKRSRELVLQRLAINKINFSSFLPKIHVPVLGIVGNHTKVGVNIMKRVIELIPNARLEIFDNSFDPSNLCQPTHFNQRVSRFLYDARLV